MPYAYMCRDRDPFHTPHVRSLEDMWDEWAFQKGERSKFSQIGLADTDTFSKLLQNAVSAMYSAES